MLPATTLSYGLWPPPTATGNHRPFTVSARYSRPRKNISYDYDYDEDEDEDEEKEKHLELDTWKPQEIWESNAPAPNSKDKAEISGSVVLLALQKATAKKTSKKIKKKSKNIKAEEDKQGNSSADYSDVKPLCIKSDWKDRLDELEKQLHQLVHNT